MIQANVKHPNSLSHPALRISQEGRRWTRTNAILIRIKQEGNTNQEGSYATVAAAIKSRVDLKEFGVSIDRFKKTKACDLLVEVGRGCSASVEFSNVIVSTVYCLGEVRHLQEMSRIVIRGIDIMATEEEAASTIRAVCGFNEIKMGKMRKEQDRQKAIDVTFPQKFADILFVTGRLRIK